MNFFKEDEEDSGSKDEQLEHESVMEDDTTFCLPLIEAYQETLAKSQRE